MMPRFANLLFVLLVALAVPAGASAATTVGDTTSTPDAYYGGGVVAVAGGVSVPEEGIVTALALRAHTTSAATFRALVLRPVQAGTYTVVAAADVPVTDTNGSFTRVEVPVRFAVRPGDVPAVYVPPAGEVGALSSGQGTSGAVSGPPAVDAWVDAPDPVAAVPSVSAVVEPDADRDGFGDDSQDACPTVNTRHAPPCTGDLVAGLIATPASIVAGDVTTLTGHVIGNGAGAVAHVALPDGLTPLLVTSTAGDCIDEGDRTYDCRLGDFAGGDSQKVYALVRGTATGAQTATFYVTSDIDEQRPFDNAAAGAVNVTAPAVVTPATVTPPPVTPAIRLCRVPSLKGRTTAGAKSLLKRAGCATGAIAHATVRRARVASQRIPAGTRVLAGTKVGFTLRSAKPKHR
jgi:hypothetical protein